MRPDLTGTGELTTMEVSAGPSMPPPSGAPSAGARQSRVKRILIVEDEPALIDILIEHFIDSPYEVDTATNGIDAMAAVASERPDVVLLDIKMPGMDGIEVLKRIMKADPSISVIMVTGVSEVPVTAEALRQGAFGCVPTPFDLRYLEHLVAVGLTA